VKLSHPHLTFEPFDRSRFELATWGRRAGYEDRVGFSLSRGHEGSDPTLSIDFEISDPPRWLQAFSDWLDDRNERARARRWRGWTRRQKKRNHDGSRTVQG
jgi:hypothetical protein